MLARILSDVSRCFPLISSFDSGNESRVIVQNSWIATRHSEYSEAPAFSSLLTGHSFTLSVAEGPRVTGHWSLATGHRLLLLLFLLLQLSTVNCRLLSAQTTNATLNGQVTDTSGAAIPNAKVCAINEATNVHYETKTNNDGIYVEPNLPPGTYKMEITRDGFKNIVQPGLELHVQDARAANYTLQVGSASETVTVKENSYTINTQDATVSTTIDRNFAENLPLNGRSFQTLILLTPGTTLVTSLPATKNGGQFSVNGQRANANSFTVDGMSANTGGYLYASFQTQLTGANAAFTVAGTTQGMVSVDALQEFKIQTSTYAPEFGRQPGGQVSLLTRSGTNAFHGTAFDYLRNTVLDANDWFNNENGVPKGAERQNDFGGTLGGPIFKDKTFFFFSYEGLRLLQPTTNVDTVPSLRLRQEAASAFQAILNSWPLPDGPEGVDSKGNPTGGAPYTDSQSFPTSLDSYSIKIDHTFGKRLHLFGRYSDVLSKQTFIVDAPNVLLTESLRGRALTIGTDFSIRPNLQNELRLNYTVNVSLPAYAQNLVSGAVAYDASILSPAPLVASNDNSNWRFSTSDSYFPTTFGTYGKYSQRQIGLLDNMSHIFGSHQIKWGIDYRRLFPIYGLPPTRVAYIVNSESNLMAGIASSVSVIADQVPHPIYANFSVYAQDAWRMTKRLSFTYGLRWELNPTPGERNGIQPLNVLGLNNPTTATLAPINSSLYKTTYNNFAPRLGLAYQVRQSSNHETVIRGGLGMFYDLNSETAAIGFDNEPFSNHLIKRNVSFPIPDNTFSVPLVPAPLSPPYYANAIDPNLKLPYTLQWNVSIEQALGQNQSLTMSYIASAGYRLLRSDELVDFNPNFTYVTELRNASSSNYQSLQLQFNRRLARGLQALASYTYSHSIDNASTGERVASTLSTSASGNVFPNPNIDKGNSDFDLRHALRGALTYNLPSWKDNLLSKVMFSGWSLDTIGISQTGLPVDLIGGYYFPSATPDAYFALRPNLVQGKPLYLHGSQFPGGMAFNPEAFAAVPEDANGNPTEVQGTLGRNVMRGFGAWQMDFALHRQFNLTERVSLQFRSEFFNVFNHPNFGNIDSFIGDGTFGKASSMLNQSYGSGLNYLYQIGGPRSIQLALKLAF